MRPSTPFLLAALIAAFSGAWLAVRVPAAHAASDPCVFAQADFDKIAAVQNDPTLTANQEVMQELAVRKALVGQTIACAETQIASLKDTLQNATGTDSTADVRSQLLSSLGGASDFYGIENAKLSDAGIAGTKLIAREIIDWRAGTYAPLEGEVNNYLLWVENQPLFLTAQTRMDQTQRAVAFLESAATDAKLEAAFNAAYASFQDAKQQNAAARQALAQSLAPDQSIALIKQSLESLSSTYQQFFAVSDAIKAILPQP